MPVAPGVSLSVERRIEQADINRFAQATGSSARIHVNPEWASQTPLGKTVAHGLFILAAAPQLIHRLTGNPLWYVGGKLTCRYLKPVHPGDTVTTTVTCRTVELREHTAIGMMDVVSVNQHGNLVLSGTAEAPLGGQT